MFGADSKRTKENDSEKNLEIESNLLLLLSNLFSSMPESGRKGQLHVTNHH